MLEDKEKMAVRAYQSSKPNGAAPHPARQLIPNPPPSKSNPSRHPYRPTPTSSRRRKEHQRLSCRRCCCLTCLWTVLVLFGILLLAAVSAAAFYALYHPRRPLFSVTSLKISVFNLTTAQSDESTRLTTRINLTLSAKNPNKRPIAYTYDPMSVAVESGPISLCNGSLPGLTSSPGNISVVHASMETNHQLLDGGDATRLKSDLRGKRGMDMAIVVDTMAGVKVEKLRMKKVGIRIRCDGVHGGQLAKGKNVTLANTANSKCRVDVRIKIWKWTF